MDPVRSMRLLPFLAQYLVLVPVSLHITKKLPKVSSTSGSYETRLLCLPQQTTDTLCQHYSEIVNRMQASFYPSKRGNALFYLV